MDASLSCLVPLETHLTLPPYINIFSLFYNWHSADVDKFYYTKFHYRIKT